VTVKSHEPVSPPISLETSLGQLKQLLKHLGLTVATELLNRLVEILKETRYGLRQSEICDLLGHSKHNNDSVLVWLLFKFYPRLAESANSLARSLVDNDQVLHKLFVPCKFKISEKRRIRHYFNHLVLSIFVYTRSDALINIFSGLNFKASSEYSV